MLNVAIVEDDQLEADLIQKHLQHYAKQNDKTFHIEWYKGAEEFLNFYKTKYDVVFMDIELPGINGMNAAKRLRAMDSVVIIIFVTNMKQFACDGYPRMFPNGSRRVPLGSSVCPL